MMRLSLPIRIVVVGLAVILLAEGVCHAQRRERRRFVGRGPLALLRAEQVQDELELTDDQKSQVESLLEESRARRRELFSGLRDLSREERREKLRELGGEIREAAEESQKKLNAILNEEQQTRLGEISLQVRGISALADKTVAEKLELSAEQRGKIRDLLQAQREMRRGWYRELRDLPREQRREKFREIREKSEALREETEKAVTEALTDDQKERWNAMKGEAFELDRSAFFRGRRGRRSDR